MTAGSPPSSNWLQRVQLRPHLGERTLCVRDLHVSTVGADDAQVRKFEGGSEDVGEVQRGRNPLPTSAESQLELSEAEDEPPGYDGEAVHTTRRWSRLTLCALPKKSDL